MTSDRIDSALDQGYRFPYDATDDWWSDSGWSPVPPFDWAHSAARGIIANLTDRRGIKNGFNDVDEEIRREIVETCAEIIRRAAISKATGEQGEL